MVPALNLQTDEDFPTCDTAIQFGALSAEAVSLLHQRPGLHRKQPAPPLRFDSPDVAELTIPEKRKLAHREAAKQFALRSDAYNSALEAMVKKLENENLQLLTHTHTLLTENAKLRNLAHSSYSYIQKGRMQ